MDLGIKDKRALVLSSSRGLGLAVGAALADEGAAVFLVGRNRERLIAAADKINARRRGKATPIVADLAKPTDIESLIATVEQATGGIVTRGHVQAMPMQGCRLGQSVFHAERYAIADAAPNCGA
jgi:3-oxoacyl-[acyl-carrier protein] reductase